MLKLRVISLHELRLQVSVAGHALLICSAHHFDLARLRKCGSRPQRRRRPHSLLLPQPQQTPRCCLTPGRTHARKRCDRYGSSKNSKRQWCDGRRRRICTIDISKSSRYPRPNALQTWHISKMASTFASTRFQKDRRQENISLLTVKIFQYITGL